MTEEVVNFDIAVTLVDRHEDASAWFEDPHHFAECGDQVCSEKMDYGVEGHDAADRSLAEWE